MKRHYCRPDSEAEPGPVLCSLIEQLAHGDVLEVPDICHLALSFRALKLILSALEAKGARLHVLHVSGSPAESMIDRFRRDLRRAAVVRAAARGAYAGNKGRPRTVDTAAIAKLRNEGLEPRLIATRLGCGRSSVYSALKAA